MAPRPTVIGTQGYRRGLASLSVVKERLFRVHRNARRSYLRPRVQQQLHMATAAKDRIGLVWWDLSGRVARPRLPALLTSACAEFLLRVLAALRLVLEIPCGTSCNQPLATNHCCKNSAQAEVSRAGRRGRATRPDKSHQTSPMRSFAA